MNIEQALQSIGLTQKESAVYMSCLELGQDSITHIAKKSGIKRPTVYLILESLQARGLINTVTKGKRTFYGGEEPQKLIGLLAEKQRSLQTVLPFLEALNNRRSEKPKVRFYEGKEGVLRIYEEMFEEKEMRFWGSMEVVSKEFEEVIRWFTKISDTKKIRVFDLLTDTPRDRAYAKRVKRPGYEIRFFPKDLTTALDTMIGETKISLNAFSPEPYGIIIESKAIADSMRSLWELAWRGAYAYQKIMKQKK